MGQRAAELASFERRQVRLPDPGCLSRIRLSHPRLGPEVLQRRPEILRRDHHVLVPRYHHRPILASYRQTVISLSGDMTAWRAAHRPYPTLIQ